MTDYLAKPIEEEKLHNLLLRYKHSTGTAIRAIATEPLEPVVSEHDARLAAGVAASRRKK